ncbi:MAG: TolC family protein [Rhabdochlamydiaceae bacterium]|nr:TolC family protein [Candidatus Amphrikana amoebophyrae]
MKSVSILTVGFIFLCSCNVYKEAAHPYSLAPATHDSNWTPPSKILQSVNKRQEAIPTPKIDSDRDYSMGEIIDLGLLYNTKTKESWSKARAAAANYGKKLQDYFVLSQFDSTYQRLKYPQLDVNQTVSDFTTKFQNELNFSYTILDFGQTRFTSDAALYALYEADWSHNHEIQFVMQELMNDYFNVVYQQELLIAYFADVEDAIITLDSTEEKLRTGMSDISDVLQARTYYLDTKLKVVNQQQKLNTAFATLKNDMGISSNLKFTLQNFPTEYEYYEPKPFEQLMELAKKSRPDYLAALSDVESKEYALSAARSQYYPTVDGSFAIGNTQGNNGLNDNYDFDVQVSLNLPLFQGFFQQNQIKLTKANLSTSQSKLLAIELLMTKEISVYQDDISFSLESIDYSTQYYETAQEDYKVNLDKYKQGTNNIVDVINALTAVADARAKEILAKKEYFQSLSNLAYALGSLNVNPHNLENLEQLDEEL